MKLKISTRVGSPVADVEAGFDQSLFLALSPPFPPVKVLRFDGCRTGDSVVLRLNFLLFSQTWESRITSDRSAAGEFSFVDEGVRLPFFLKRWKHHHLVTANGEGGSIITDDIEYSCGSLLADLLMHPLLSLQFWYRKPVYRKVFGR